MFSMDQKEIMHVREIAWKCLRFHPRGLLRCVPQDAYILEKK